MSNEPNKPNDQLEIVAEHAATFLAKVRIKTMKLAAAYGMRVAVFGDQVLIEGTPEQAEAYEKALAKTIKEEMVEQVRSAPGNKQEPVGIVFKSAAHHFATVMSRAVKVGAHLDLQVNLVGDDLLIEGKPEHIKAYQEAFLQFLRVEMHEVFRDPKPVKRLAKPNLEDLTHHHWLKEGALSIAYAVVEDSCPPYITHSVHLTKAAAQDVIDNMDDGGNGNWCIDRVVLPRGMTFGEWKERYVYARPNSRLKTEGA